MGKKVIRARKNLIIVAYDISETKRRSKVVKILLKYGSRINFSVFECMVSDTDLERLKSDIRSHINVKKDIVAYYPICMKCYSKVCYQRSTKVKHETVTVV